MIDAVITYVDGSDPEWRKQYSEAAGKDPSKRHREWGTLEWQVRNIRRYLPFIDKIFLVVALPSQVPDGVKDKVRVVLHKDFIPAEYLPTFNSNTIEMFLYRIGEMSDRYLYINDDCIPVAPGSEDEYFDGDNICRGFAKHLLAPNMFKKIVRHTDSVARKAAGLRPSPIFIRPQHSPSPQIKSVGEEIMEKVPEDLLSSLTAFRREWNVCNYVLPDYMYHMGRVKLQRLSCRHFSMGAGTPAQLEAFLNAPDRKWICINDVQMSAEREREFREVISKAAAK